MKLYTGIPEVKSQRKLNTLYLNKGFAVVKLNRGIQLFSHQSKYIYLCLVKSITLLYLKWMGHSL